MRYNFEVGKQYRYQDSTKGWRYFKVVERTVKVSGLTGQPYRCVIITFKDHGELAEGRLEKDTFRDCERFRFLPPDDSRSKQEAAYADDSDEVDPDTDWTWRNREKSAKNCGCWAKMDAYANDEWDAELLQSWEILTSVKWESLKVSIRNMDEDKAYSPRPATVEAAVRERDWKEWLQTVIGLAVRHWYGRECRFWRDNRLRKTGICGQVYGHLPQRRDGSHDCAAPNVRLDVTVNGLGVVTNDDMIKAMLQG